MLNSKDQAAPFGDLLAGRVAMVTGAGRGIGRSIALTFARAGASVAIVDQVQDRAEGAASEVRDLGQQALALVGDVSRSADSQRWVQETVARLGKLDILVNNAGARTRYPFLDFPEDEMDRIIAVTLKGPFLCSQAAAREMAKRHYGRIVNISSVVAESATVLQAAYSAAKGGINALTYVTAAELAPFGITVNAIAPGIVDTPHQTGDKSDADIRDRLRCTPLGRMGSPEEIAGLALFLASDLAAWMTGSIVRMDGGFNAARVFPEPIIRLERRNL